MKEVFVGNLIRVRHILNPLLQEEESLIFVVKDEDEEYVKSEIKKFFETKSH